MDAFLDIGFTLLGGPQLSPPKMIAKILGLEDGAREALSEIVFSMDHESPLQLIESLEQMVQRPVRETEKADVVDFWNSQYKEVYPLPWARRFVSSLVDSGVRIHVTSNLWFPFYDMFRRIFERSLPHIESETLSFREGVKKPSPEFYRIALRRSGADPLLSFSVGDSLNNDILPYADMGMTCIWYASRPLSPEKTAAAEKIVAANPRVHKVSCLKDAFSIIRGKTTSFEDFST